MGLLRPGHQWDAVDDYFESELRRANENGTGDEVEDAIVDTVVDRVVARHSSVPRAELEERARAEYEDLEASPITTYIPNLIEHALRSLPDDEDGITS